MTDLCEGWSIIYRVAHAVHMIEFGSTVHTVHVETAEHLLKQVQKWTFKLKKMNSWKK